MIYGCDISQFQGMINWDELNSVSNFVMIRAAYGTMPDTMFAANQAEARRVQASAGPLGIGYYYYAYPTLLDAPTSAKYFLDTVGRLDPGEILALDLEGNVGPEPVAWALDFMQVVQELVGTRPLIYLNQSEVTSYDWSALINNGNGLWLANYSGNKNLAPPSGPWPFAAMTQWTDADTVAGISGNVDGDMFQGDITAFEAYGIQPAPPATPVSTATVPPAPAAPLPTPVPSETAATTPPAPTPASTGQSSSETSSTVIPPVNTSSRTFTQTVTSTVSDDETELVNWLGTVSGGFVIKLVGLVAGYLLAHVGGLHLNDFATSLVGYLAGSTVHDSQT